MSLRLRVPGPSHRHGDRHGCSVPRLRHLKAKCAGGCGAADKHGPFARGAATTRPGTRYLPVTRLLRSPERAPNGTYSASVIYLRSQWGCYGGPKIVSIPDPCCDPSAAVLLKSHAGPRSNSLREFESIHIIGGQRSH